MEIRIDTNKDSSDEIKKAIRMLRAYLGGYSDSDNLEQSYSNKTHNEQSSIPEPSPGMLNMFGTDEPQTYNDDDDDKSEPKVEIIEY